MTATFQKIFGFNFIRVLALFQKYAMTSVHKIPKIYFNIHYFKQIADTVFFLIKLICLAENFKATALTPFEIELIIVNVRRKNYSLADVQLPLNSPTFPTIRVQ